MNSATESELGPSIRAFEAMDFDAEKFDHSAHLYVAWSYLRRHDLSTASRRYRDTLKKLTRKLGVPDKYHETITWFYLIVIAERLADQECNDWHEFVASNSDLFARNPSLICQFYADEVINSDRARQSFVLPQPH